VPDRCCESTKLIDNTERPPPLQESSTDWEPGLFYAEGGQKAPTEATEAYSPDLYERVGLISDGDGCQNPGGSNGKAQQNRSRSEEIQDQQQPLSSEDGRGLKRPVSPAYHEPCKKLRPSLSNSTAWQSENDTAEPTSNNCQG
jgi:hypothetical protein